MLCKECKATNVPTNKIAMIYCEICGLLDFVMHGNTVCEDCSEEFNFCEKCGTFVWKGEE